MSPYIVTTCDGFIVNETQLIQRIRRTKHLESAQAAWKTGCLRIHQGHNRPRKLELARTGHDETGCAAESNGLDISDDPR